MNDFVALLNYFLLPFTYFFFLPDAERAEFDLRRTAVIIAEKNFVLSRIDPRSSLRLLKLTVRSLNLVELFLENFTKFIYLHL